MKKRSELSRLLRYAEGHERLTLLGCILSGIAAVLGLVPCVYSRNLPVSTSRSLQTHKNTATQNRQRYPPAIPALPEG